MFLTEGCTGAVQFTNKLPERVFYGVCPWGRSSLCSADGQIYSIVLIGVSASTRTHLAISFSLQLMTTKVRMKVYTFKNRMNIVFISYQYNFEIITSYSLAEEKKEGSFFVLSLIQQRQYSLKKKNDIKILSLFSAFTLYFIGLPVMMQFVIKSITGRRIIP